jgi:hypothetical protein
MSDAKAAAEILAHLQPARLDHERHELRAVHHQTGEAFREWYTDHLHLAREALSRTARGWHTWYGVALRNGRRAGDANCTRTLAVIADTDYKLWDGDAAATHAAIDTFPLRPSVDIISGGGGQLYWLLATPLDLRIDAGRFRKVATRLSRALAGADRAPDTVSNPERILRVPYSLNWKTDPPKPVTVRWCEPDRRYSLAELEAWPTPTPPGRCCRTGNHHERQPRHRGPAPV